MASHTGPIRVMHVGLGPIGASVVRQIIGRKGFRIVGAVDDDPDSAGRDLGEVAEAGRPLKIKVSADVRTTIKAARPDVVVLCTGSRLRSALPRIQDILALKVPIVSTAEELVYPSKANMKYARAIDAAARKGKVAVLATGANPGFVMDALPIALTAACARVDTVHVERVQDARFLHLGFQQKIGAGLTREQFQKRVDDGSVRHVGLTESISMIAGALRWKLDRITDQVQPKIAAGTVAGELLAVDAGFVCGIVQDGVGYRNGEPAITMHLEAYLGAPQAYDAIDIAGSPGVTLRIAGGIHDDIATASMVVNALPRILEAAPGLHTMRDMPLPAFFDGR